MSIRTRFHLTFEYAVFECYRYYASTPIQYTSIFYRCENDNFPVKNHNIFLFFFLQTSIKVILETPHRGVSNEYPQSMFYSKNKKNVYPVHPRFTILKWGVKGYTSHGHVIRMEGNDSTSDV